MTKMTDKERGLTKVQRKMLERIRAGYFYSVGDHDPMKPPSPNLQVLLDRGLVCVAGRWVKIESCYVPKGFKQTHKEHFPPFICTHANKYTAWYGEQGKQETHREETQCPTCGEVLKVIYDNPPPPPEPEPSRLRFGVKKV